MSELRWYVVEARESAVREALLNLAVSFSRYGDECEVWAPFDVRRSANRARSASKRVDQRIPRFGRFLFIRCVMTDSLAHAIRETGGVVDVLRHAGSVEVAPVPDEHIIYLRENPVLRRFKSDFVVGDIVMLVEGPFAGIPSKVEAIDRRGSLSISVTVFGRPTPLVVEVGHVKMHQQAKSRSIEGVTQHRHRRSAKHARKRAA